MFAPLAGAPLAEEYEAEAALVSLRREESEIQQRIQAAQSVVDAAKERRAAEVRRADEERKRAAAAAAAAELARQAELRRQQERERQAQLQRERAARGTQRKYSLYPNAKETIDENFDECTKIVALNPTSEGAFVIDENGGYAHSAGMPDGLYDLMQEEKKKKRNKRTPAYVALGSENRYYIRFTDGSSQWSGDGDEFDKRVREGKSKGGIRSVAFGEPDSWFIVYGNGGWSNLSDCPGLNNKISARNRRGDLTCVSLGPNGEWYLAAENGRAWWGGYSDISALPEQIKHIKERITFMDFGGDDTFIVRYE